MRVKNLIAYWMLFWNSLAICYLFLAYILTGEVPFFEDNQVLAYLELTVCFILMALGLIWFCKELKKGRNYYED